MPANAEIQRSATLVGTGITALDLILGGGLPANRAYLLEGTPGSGKTTIALQFLLEGARHDEIGLYITLSEKPPWNYAKSRTAIIGR